MNFSNANLKTLQTKAAEFGFDHVALTQASIPKRDQQQLTDWCLAGYAADMNYMTRNPKERWDIPATYPGVKSVLTLGVSYYQGPFPEKPGKAYGRVARYAWGKDYHDVILDRLRQFLPELQSVLGSDVKATLAVDTKPLLERALAKQAGLGFVGKNTVLIMPRSQNGTAFHVGSWIFLTEILLDVDLAEDVIPSKVEDGCGSCTKCMTACPTDAFEKPYKLNADKCIAYQTIENKGWIPRDLRSSIGDWLFGCDVCQDVCPFNARAYETTWPEFKSEHGAGAWISLEDLFQIPDQPAFKKKWGTTPLSRPKRKGLLRNACIVAGNSGDDSLVPQLNSLCEDEEPVVRGHALWALNQIDSVKSRSRAEKLRQDSDPHVRDECEIILQ